MLESNFQKKTFPCEKNHHEAVALFTEYNRKLPKNEDQLRLFSVVFS